MRPLRHRLPTFCIHGVRHLGVQREDIELRKVETIEIQRMGEKMVLGFL